jgi:hypothetical protein
MELELPAPVDDICYFRDDSGCSSWMRLRTLGVALLVGRAVLRLLLACAPLPDAVTWDASIGVALGRGAVDALLAGREYRVSACRIWFNRRLSGSTSVAIHGEYFDRSNSASSP